jgi:putative DNA primase/helicase
VPDSALLSAALAYAARGWPVFPCRASDSAEVDGQGKPLFAAKAPLVRGGLKAASAEAGQIRTWWARWPDALIGLPLGGPTGIFALDFDPRETLDPETGELERFTLTQLKADTEALIGCALPATVGQMTPSGGVHIFFRQPGEGPPIRNRGCLPLHVDVRGEGGYVIVPPSVVKVNAKGAVGPYRWLRGDLEHEPAEAPAILIDVLRAPKGGRVIDGRVVEELTRNASPGNDLPPNSRPKEIGLSSEIEEGRRRYGLALLSKLTAELGAAREGSRGETLNRAAFVLGGAVAAGIVSRAIAAHELAQAAARCGLTAKDGDAAVQANIDRALRDGEARPLDLAAVDRDSIEWRQRRAGGSGRRSAAAGTSRPAAAAALPSDSAEPSAPPPGPPFGTPEFRPSHVGGKRRRRGKKWGPGQAWDWVWVWELVAAVRDLQRCAGLPETDLGNAERWAILHGAAFRYSEELGWLSWDGRRWKREGGDPRSYPPMLGRSAIGTIRRIQLEAKWIEGTGCPDEFAATLAGVRHDPAGQNHVLRWVGPKDDKVPLLRSQARAKFGRDCEASGRIGAVTALARLQPGVAVSSAVFDRAPMLFNVANGTLEFRRAEAEGGAPEVVLRPHDPADMLTKVSPVFYDPAATAPLYDSFFTRAQPDAAMRRFLHAWAGYSLTGETGEQSFVILHGTEGGNGKSTWEQIRAHVMGDYAQKVNVETFLDGNFEKSGAQASPDIARLPGARMVYTAEPKQGKRFAEDLIKVVTGGETVTARHLNRDFFEFLPEFKISVACNRPPEASDDAAFWRRVLMTPWDVSVPKAERDKMLPVKLQAQASGVLNLFVSGALDWMAGGLPVPGAVTAATERYQQESDPLGRFISMALVVDAGSCVQSSHLYDIFKAWCRFAGEKEWTQTGFSKALGRKGFHKIQRSNMFWLGLRPAFEVAAFEEEILDNYGARVGTRPRAELDQRFAADPATYLDPTRKGDGGGIDCGNVTSSDTMPAPDWATAPAVERDDDVPW